MKGRGGEERRAREGGIREEQRKGEQRGPQERDVDVMEEEVTLPPSPRFSPHPSVFGRLGENSCQAPI